LYFYISNVQVEVQVKQSCVTIYKAQSDPSIKKHKNGGYDSLLQWYLVCWKYFAALGLYYLQHLLIK